MQCKVKTFRIAQLQNMLFAQFVQFVSKVYILNDFFKIVDNTDLFIWY